MLEDDAIFEFEDVLAKKLHALDTREHCRACYEGELDPDDGDDYVSADGFLYARCVVVANGREFYASVLADPVKMPQAMEFESLLSLPAAAFERKTGKEYEHIPRVSYESFQNSAGWAPTAATRPESLPGKMFLPETAGLRKCHPRLASIVGAPPSRITEYFDRDFLWCGNHTTSEANSLTPVTKSSIAVLLARFICQSHRSPCLDYLPRAVVRPV